MADSVIGAVLGDAISQLLKTITYVKKETGKYRSKLTQLEVTITIIKPIFDEGEKLNEVLQRPIEEMELFVNQLKEADILVLRCGRMKWMSFYKEHRYLSKLDNVNRKLLRFFENYVQLQLVKNMQKITEKGGSSGLPLLKGDVKELVLVAEDGQERTEKGSWSGAPLLKGDVIGFDDQVRDLKTMVLNCSAVDDCSVVVVSAAGGCGKTTLVTKLCQDPQIQENFGRNIYFATISETPNIKVVVRNLLWKNRGSQQLDFASDEDATYQWGSFLGESRSEVLLVLDDVWSASIVMMFRFKLPTYKILVTSRRTFKQFNTYELQPLNDQDATNLFHHSAFSVHGSKHTNVPDELVTEMVKCCKKHPLALCVIGGLLKEANVASWFHMLKKLSRLKQSILDLDKSIQLSLERSLDVLEKEPEIKQCYLDLGLFPEDQKIATTKLMDMWVHLYKHDKEGLDTISMLSELASRYLATLMQLRKRLPPIDNFCEEQFVMQHNVMGMLAIHLNNKGPVEERVRLIIKANEPDGRELPWLPHTVNARLLSIFTDERFSMGWNDCQAPKVEVLLLNFTAEIYVLPHFIQSMERLKVLFITNYGQYFSHPENFPAPQYLSGLTSIRLELISVSSISTSILELVNLRKLSLIMCKIGNSFEECITNGIHNKLPSLLEIEMDSCDDLLTFPAMLCNLFHLKKLSITNCFELISLSEEFGSLRNLEVLRLTSCSNLRALPESVGKLQKLSMIDLFGCLSLHELPDQIGELGSLRRIDMTGCSGLHELPQSVNSLHQLEVVCDEEISFLWSSHTNVKVELVEEDRWSTFRKIITSGIQEFHPASEPNREVIDRQFLSRDKTQSFYDLMQLDYVQRADVLTRTKDFLHLIWFYPVKKEAEVNFGFLVDKFSLLNKYIRKSLDPSRTRNYLLKIQTLLQDIDEHLDDAASDIVAYLPGDSWRNWSRSVELENLATGEVFSAYFWSDIPEIHATATASASRRALSCIMDLKFKKLGISGDGAEDVAETLKNMPELRTMFDMVLCVRVTYKHHSIEELMNNIEEEILLWKKRSSETGNEIDVPDESLNSLLFIDYGNNLIDLHEVEFRMSKRYRTVQIVMTSKRQNVHFQVDLEIRMQDHLLPWILFSRNADLATVGMYPSIERMAKLLIEECHGHLLAIILLARSLRGVIDVSVWKLTLQELASQQEPSSSELRVVCDVMVRVLRCIWSRMETLSQNCIIQFALHYVGAEVEKSSLIDSWVGDGLVKGAHEGEHAFEELISSFLLEPVGETCVRMRDETRVTLLAYFVPRAYGLYLKRDGLESNRMPNLEEWNAREIYLSNNIVSELPDSPNCPILVDLLLNSNEDLMDIPITFFDHMPSVRVLNFSKTSIKCLPSSVLKLISLRELIMRDCDLLMELPPEIGALRNLKLFDSEGTQLIYLPDQFGSLTKLECLRFSLYNHADRYRQSKKLMQIIPATSLSKLVRLKELSICVDSYDEWWEDEAKQIIDVLSKVRNLESLKLYIPTTELLRKFMEQQNWEGVSIYSYLSNFSFTVGRLQQRVIFRLPLELEKMFVKLPKCLKYTNGEGDMEVIAMALEHAHALFLERHWTIKSLSTFGAAEMKRLKFCLLSECNELLEVVNGSEGSFIGPMLGSLEYLAIHHMKSLSRIWKGPIHVGSLVNLETLVMNGCPELRTILTDDLLDNLIRLEYLIVEDCANVNSIISSGSCYPMSTRFLPRLKKMSLLQLPELVSISNGISIAPRLESLVVYDCPKLEKLSHMEVCDAIKEIKGENEWWFKPELISCRPEYLANVFSPLGTDDIMDELSDAINFLPQLSG